MVQTLTSNHFVYAVYFRPRYLKFRERDNTELRLASAFRACDLAVPRFLTNRYEFSLTCDITKRYECKTCVNIIDWWRTFRRKNNISYGPKATCATNRRVKVASNAQIVEDKDLRRLESNTSSKSPDETNWDDSNGQISDADPPIDRLSVIMFTRYGIEVMEDGSSLATHCEEV